MTKPPSHEGRPTGSALRRQDVQDIYPLSPTQQGMLFHRSYSAEGRTYFVQARLLLEGPLVAEHFAEAWQQVVRRHAPLRTAFVSQKVKQPVQVVLKPEAVQFALQTVSNQPMTPEAVEQFLLADYERGFDLAAAPLMRVSVLPLGAQLHLLVWSHEHLVVDGWSLPIVLGEVMALYEGLVTGQHVELPTVRPYREYLSWLGRQDSAKAEGFFRDWLRGVRQPTPLPATGTGVGVDPDSGAAPGFEELWQRLSREQTNQLRRATRRGGLTVNTAVQAAWALTLALASGQSDVVFGATGSGRASSLPGAESRVGLFLGTLPMRVKLSWSQSVSSWLQRVQADAAKLRQYEYFGLSKIQQCSECRVEGSERTSLFDSLLVFENYPTGEVLNDRSQSLCLKLYSLPTSSAVARRSAERNNLPLTLVVDPSAELGLMFAFDRTRFAGEALRPWLALLADGLCALVEALAHEGDAISLGQAVERLADRRSLPAAVSGVKGAVAGERKPEWIAGLTAPAAVEAGAEQWPQRVALSGVGGSLTFAELSVRTGQWASALRFQYRESVGSRRRRGELNVGMDWSGPPRVAICAERSTPTVSLLLAVQRAGMTPVLLDPSWPVPRLCAALADSGVWLVVADEPRPVQSALVERQQAVRVEALADFAASASLQPEQSLTAPLCEEAPAYCLYTSGSTGQPKAIEVSHRALLSYVRGIAERLQWRSGLRMALMTSLAADLGYTTLWGSLCCGGTLHIVEPAVSLDGELLADWLSQHPVDVMKLTPTQLRLLHGGAFGRSIVPLQQLVLGGEGLTESLVAQLRQEHPALQIVQHYGPTETAVGVVAGAVQPGAGGAQFAPLGTALGHARVEVLSPAGHRLPAGAVGELSIAGPSLAHGYFRQPAMTAERFVPDPSGPAGARRYRSGDLGRVLPDGRLQFVGRRDGQRKVHGVRVESAEIQAVLASHSALRAAAVTVRLQPQSARSPSADSGEARDGAWEQPPWQIVAYFVPTAERTASVEPLEAELSRWMLDRLPVACQPTHWVALAELPMTASGKLDERALPEVLGEREADHCVEAASTPVQEQLVGLWREVLGGAERGVDRSFLQWGGDSIQGLQVVSRARKLGLHFTPKQLFDSSSLAALAEQLTQLPSPLDGSRPRAPGGAPSSMRGPLLPSQKRFFQRKLKQPAHFNQALLVRVRAGLDRGAVQAAWQALVAHHPQLAVVFPIEPASCQRVQCQQTACLPPLEYHDLSRLADSERTAQIQWLSQRAQEGFDLESGPLARLVWFDAGPQPGRMLFVAHHLLVDAVSWRVLLEDFASLLAGQPLASPTSSSLAWAEAIEAARSKGLWQDYLPWLPGKGGLECREIWAPGGWLPEAVTVQNTEAQRRSVTLRLSVEQTKKLRQAVPSHGGSLDDLLLTSLGCALAGAPSAGAAAPSHWLVELEGHGRQFPEGGGVIDSPRVPGASSGSGLDVSRSVGWFTTRFALCLPVRGELVEASSEQALRWVQDTGVLRSERAQASVALFALDNAELDASHPVDVSRASSPVAVGYNHLGSMDDWAGEWLSPAPENVGHLRSPEATRSHWLECTVRSHRHEVNGQLLALQLDYCGAMGEQSAMQALLDSWLSTSLQLAEKLQPNRLAGDEGALLARDPTLCRLDSAQWLALRPSRKQFESVYTLTPLQQGLVFEGLRRPGAYEYCLEAEVPELRAEQLVQAFAQLQRHSELLRTRVFTHAGEQALCEPVGCVYRPEQAPLPVVEVALKPGESVDGQMAQWVLEQRSRGLDLSRELPWRLLVAQVPAGPGEAGAVRLVWLRHHVVADGWSTRLLLQRLGQLLRRSSQEPPWKDSVPFDFLAAGQESDFADYLRWLRRQDQAAAQDYFRRQLQTLPGLTALPASFGGPQRSTEETQPLAIAQQRSAALPGGVDKLWGAEQTNALRRAATHYGVTANTLVQGAWALLLSRAGAGPRVCFGVTVNGRPAELAGVERCLGVFINTLPLVTAVPLDAPCGQWLRQLQSLGGELQHYQFADLRSLRVGAERATSHLTSCLVFDTQLNGEAEAGELIAAQPIERHEGPHFALSLLVSGHRQLRLQLQHDRRVYSAARAEQLMSLVSHWLEQLVQSAQPLAGRGQPCLGELAWEHPWPATPVAVTIAPRDVACLPAQMAAIVAQYPERIALCDGGQPISYRQVWERSGWIAAALQAQGVGPEVGVALHIERSLDQWIAQLAVLRAGGYYIPLDPEQPLARKLRMLGALPVRLVVQGVEASARVRAEDWAGLGCLTVDSLQQEGQAREAFPSHVPGLRADHLAYVIHTSGSTGQPKAVAVTHRQVHYLFEGVSRHIRFGAEDVWGGFHSACFDVSVWELWGAWLHGGCLALVPAALRHDSERFFEFLMQQQVSVLSQTPSAFYALSRAALSASWQAQHRGRSRLRCVAFAGEALDATRLASWFEAWAGNGPRLFNLYGITETTVHSTFGEVTVGDTLRPPAPSLVGVPLEHGPVDVVDAAGNLLPPGVEGEIVVSGHGLARGYLGRPGLTAERFVPDPHRQPGSRRYRSGDRAMRDASGQLLYCGRFDDQVQLRGFRVEPAEVAHALEQLPCVVAARVLVYQPQGQQAQLVAWVQVPEVPPSSNALQSQWLDALHEQLPDYMVPARFVLCERFAATANGKLDWSVLRRQLQEEAAVDSGRPELAGELEEQLAEIWREVLGVATVGPEDEFFALGGNSLTLTLALSLVRTRLQRPLTLEALYRAGTVRALARVLRELPQASAPTSGAMAGAPGAVVSSSSTVTPAPFRARRGS